MGSSSGRWGAISLSVACCSTETGGTGLDVYSTNLLRNLETEDCRVDVVQDPGLEFSIGGRSFGGYASRFVWDVFGSVPDADVVHAFDLLTFHRGADVLTVHDTYVFDHPSHFGLGGRFWRWWMRRARGLEAVIANSHTTRNKVVQHLGIEPRKVFVTHLAPDPFFSPGKGPWLQESERLDVLMVGELKTTKANLRVVRALDRLEGEVSLLWAGPRTGSEYERRVLEAARLSDSVRFEELGYVSKEELRGLYRSVDVLAFPSDDEGFGLPVLEAAACGTPSVVSFHPVFYETIGGLGVRARDLGDAFREVRWDPPSGSALVDRAGEFSWGQTAEGTREVYRRVVEGA